VILAILFATTSLSTADDKVGLNISKSKELIAAFSACRDNVITKNKKIIVLSDILEAEEQRASNFSVQYEKCDSNFNIKKKEAGAWKEKYSVCVEDSVDCGELPWWKIDFKSAGVGILLALLL